MAAIPHPAAGRRVTIIDGGSGSGKTTYARALAERTGARLVSLDEFYPGWDGLAAASRMVVDEVLNPEHPGYRRWNWAANRPGRQIWLDPRRDLVIEGCGALTPASRAAATYTIWFEMPAAERKRGALARDGDLFAAHWDRWAAQEELHWQTNRPWELADEIIDRSGH